MYAKLTAVATAILLSACAADQFPTNTVGNTTDTKGCNPTAGYTWSELQRRCMQPANEADIRFPDPEHPTLAIYGVLSGDKQYVELFASRLPNNLILKRTGTAAAPVYVSGDGTVRLSQNKTDWQLSKTLKSIK